MVKFEDVFAILLFLPEQIEYLDVSNIGGSSEKELLNIHPQLKPYLDK